MGLTRRDFLGDGVRGCTLVAAGLSVPRFLSESALAVGGVAGGAGSEGRVLVVVQMTGGNDGLNTVIPYRDDAYYRLRPVIGIRSGQVLPLNDVLGLPPQMAGFKALYDDGLLGVVEGVGYPNPNRSHFESMDIWHTCVADPARRNGSGWLGRVVNTLSGDPGLGPAVHVGADKLPLALSGTGVSVPTVPNLNAFHLAPGPVEAGSPVERLRQVEGAARGGGGRDGGGRRGGGGDDLLFVQRSILSACDQAEALRNISKRVGSSVSYPGFGLGQKLRLVADLIQAGFGARIFYASISGFDTHAKQAGQHAQLLGQLSRSIKAFFDDLGERGLADRVLLMTFSEFGRRAGENRSQGTDHGTAAPMFLVGPSVRAGIHGDAPDLTNLVDRDLRFTTDFRSVYSAVLRDWLSIRPEAVLGSTYPIPNLLRR